MIDVKTTNLHSIGWVIDARWYYTTLAACFGFVSIWETSDSGGAYAPILFLLVFAFIVNAVFYLAFRNLSAALEVSQRHETLLSSAQVAFDLIYFFVLIVCVGSGADSIAYAFYFIPIIVAMIVLGYNGVIIVALLAGLAVFLSVLLQYGIPTSAFAVTDKTEPLELALIKSLILSLIYLLTGFFGGYVSRLVRARDMLLTQKIREEEVHVKRLEALTKEFEQSAKLLVRRDLELSVANEKLQKLDQLKSEIISVAAHQLRTPLSAIKWTLKMLLDEDAGKITEEQRNLLLKGFESNERMIILVNDMLSVDLLESGKIKYNFVPVQYESLVESLIQEILPLAAKKHIRIELRRPEELLPKIKLDPDKIHDVLQNLLDNAVKYSPPDSTIKITIEATANDITTRVSDSGIGIPKDQQDKIFARFFRAANAVKNETEGSGLGLFIARSIVRRHGGEILFSSEEGVGTTFTFTLPFST
jgi:signal transduction histidine kinase